MPRLLKKGASTKLGAKARKRKTWDLGNEDSNQGKRPKESPGCAAGVDWSRSRRMQGCGKEDPRKSTHDPLYLSVLKIYGQIFERSVGDFREKLYKTKNENVSTRQLLTITKSY